MPSGGVGRLDKSFGLWYNSGTAGNGDNRKEIKEKE